jgi:ABC-type dipeptide/oligopeptide/nickel transport system permease component
MMKTFVIKRLLLTIPTVFFATIIIFLILRLLPGDAALSILGDTPHTVEMREALRAELGIDKPLPTQYAAWLRALFDGSFGGRSLETGENISAMAAAQLPVTFLLAGYTLFISILWALPLGAWAGYRPNRAGDKILGAFSLVGLSIPNIFAASILLLGLLRIFRWSPPIIYSPAGDGMTFHLQMMLWPVLILSLDYGSHLFRAVRSALITTLKKQYVLVARARGTPPPTLVLRHAGPPVAVLGISVTASHFGALLGGALVLESIFGLPGIGRGLVSAALARDFPVVQSYAILLVVLHQLVQLLADLINGMIDPRTADPRGGAQ